MTLSVRLNDEDTKLFKQYAAMLGVSVSEMVRQSVLARIEEEYDPSSAGSRCGPDGTPHTARRHWRRSH